LGTSQKIKLLMNSRKKCCCQRKKSLWQQPFDTRETSGAFYSRNWKSNWRIKRNYR